jgi:hypothetical protein
MRRSGRAAVSLPLWGACLISVLGVSAHVSDAEPLSALAGAATRDSLCPDGLDSDGDGLSDACEQSLAERFAPIVYHSSDESNFPTNVDAFLAETRLDVHDEYRPSNGMAILNPSQSDLLDKTYVGREGPAIASDGTRSLGKHRTFFLADVPVEAQKGSVDPRDWTTYFHAYPNDLGGVTIQYWRFYAFNDAANDHGGDWEGLHVVLDARAGELGVRSIRLLTHDRLTQPPLGKFQFEGTHVRVFSEGGGHATRFSGGAIGARGCALEGPCSIDPSEPATFVRQETWTGGTVTGERRGAAGKLQNLGSKARPMNGQVFVRYSGLWGSPGVFYGTSGFWGPAYNETSMRPDGFVSAWCEGMARPPDDECYPRDVSR